MSKVLRILISAMFLIIILNQGFSVKCAKNLQGADGTCIDKTYTMMFTGGQTAYYACANIIEPTLWYYESCTATVGTGTITSEEGETVAEYWSNNANNVSACFGRDGLVCNVQPIFGFQTDQNINYVGYCDSSNQNCVKCSANHVEVLKFNGSSPAINAAGNNLCESGCGADSYCDEVAVNNWSSQPISAGSPFEAHCSNNCALDDSRCRASFGANLLCDYKDPGEVCNTDSCDVQHRLVDLNGNGVSDSVSCQASCECDETPDTLLCDSGCGASPNCHRQDIGYNTVNAGCNDVCNWVSCGYYVWDTSSSECYTSCTSKSQCYSSAVCDLIGSEINNCIIDSQAPSINALTPVNNSKFNYGVVSYSFYPEDDADLTLDCSYSLNNANVSIGSVNQGSTYSNSLTVTSEDFYNVKFYCTDDSGNTGVSNTLYFLYDVTPPSYTNLAYTDLTWTVDNTLIDGDLLSVSADWTDNLELDYSELWYKTTGGWVTGPRVYHNHVNANNSLFYFDTTGLGGTTIQFRIRTSDTAGNVAMSATLNAPVYTASSDITVTLREGAGNITNRLEFVGDARQMSNIKAADSISTVALGDFYITHSGIGTTINNRFSLEQALPAGVQIKVSSSNSPSGAEYLTTAPSLLSFCNGLVPGQVCHVWMWMDTSQAVPPVLNVNSVNVASETV